MEQLEKMKMRWLNYNVEYVVSFCGFLKKDFLWHLCEVSGFDGKRCKCFKKYLISKLFHVICQKHLLSHAGSALIVTPHLGVGSKPQKSNNFKGA